MKKREVLSVFTVKELVDTLIVTVTPTGGIAVRLIGIDDVELAPPSVIVKTGGKVDGLPLSSNEEMNTFAGVVSDVANTTAPLLAVSQLATDDDELCTLKTRLAVERSPAKLFDGLRTLTV